MEVCNVIKLIENCMVVLVEDDKLSVTSDDEDLTDGSGSGDQGTGKSSMLNGQCTGPRFESYHVSFEL